MSGSGHHPPAWDRLVFWLIAAVIGLQLAASILPHLVVPIVVLAVIFVIVRLVLFHTRDW
jgi:hypothetical protein